MHINGRNLDIRGKYDLYVLYAARASACPEYLFSASSYCKLCVLYPTVISFLFFPFISLIATGLQFPLQCPLQCPLQFPLQCRRRRDGGRMLRDADWSRTWLSDYCVGLLLDAILPWRPLRG